jgi:Tfp pilus assembly protein PilF
MVGSLEPVAWDLSRLQARFEAERIRTHLTDVGIATPIAFLGHLLLLPEGVQRFVDGERNRHTDDWPLLEFSGPRALYLETARGNLWAMERAALEPVPGMSFGTPKAEAAIRISLAREYLARQLLEPAAREARRAGELDPRSAAAAHILGIVSLNQNDLAKAETAFREAVRLRPDFGEAYNDLGGTLFRLQRPDEAVEAFRRAAELHYAPALYNLGNLYLREKRDPAQAREVLERAVRQPTASAETWNALGVAYALQGDYPRAKRAWDQALRLDPQHAGARRNRERVEQSQSRPGAAGSAPGFLD